MPFPAVEGVPNSSVLALSDESARPDSETEGISEHRHLPPRTPEPFERRHNCGVSRRHNCCVRQA